MRRLTRWLALGALGLLAAPACGDPFGVDDVLGIWNTASIGGYAVPGTVLYEGVDFDTQYVRWAFYDGGLCTLTQLVDGATTTYDECRYSMDLGQQTIVITFLFEAWDGNVDGSGMTLTDPQDVVWILRRSGG